MWFSFFSSKENAGSSSANSRKGEDNGQLPKNTKPRLKKGERDYHNNSFDWLRLGIALLFPAIITVRQTIDAGLGALLLKVYGSENGLLRSMAVTSTGCVLGSIPLLVSLETLSACLYDRGTLSASFKVNPKNETYVFIVLSATTSYLMSHAFNAISENEEFDPVYAAAAPVIGHLSHATYYGAKSRLGLG